jgi:hypothetical protein
MERPHRLVGDVVDGIAGGVSGVGNGLVNSAKGIGSQVMGALDKPFEMVTHKEGPHHIVGRFLDGTLDAGANVADKGMLGSVRQEGSAIMRAMDQPFDAIPALGSMSMSKGKR